MCIFNTEYTNVVLSNVLFYIHYSSKELLNVLDLESQEVEKLTREVKAVSNVRTVSLSCCSLVVVITFF